ncbi:MAG: hypothetical protein ACNA8L_10340 [Luteolibacter sp.]
MKKPRSDSKLDSLPESRVLELRDGLLGGWKYDEALSWLAAECGVSSSLAALSGFYRRHCAPVVKSRLQLASLKAEAIGEMAGSTDWDTASIERLRQMVFEFMASPDSDMEATERMFRLLLKRKDQELAERQIKMREEAAAEAKAKLELATAKAKAKGGISEETLKELEEAAKLL